MKAWMVILLAAAIVIGAWMMTTSNERVADTNAQAKVNAARVATPPKPLFPTP